MKPIVICSRIRFALTGMLCSALAMHLGINRAVGQATTVQLPTFHFFTVNTTVLVPDGGDAFLGGIGRYAAGRTERGIPGLPSRPFDNVAAGRSSGASGVSVSAQIIDLNEMDEALLGPAATAMSHPPFATPQQLAAQRGSGTSLQSVAALKAQAAAEDASQDREAAAALERGRQLVTAGKLSVAKIYFQTAARQSSAASDIHKQALEALAAIERSKAATKIAGQ